MEVNSVIQGTAADLIKKAMIDVDSALTESGLGATMIMQVHDELVFETSEKDVDALSALVRDKMEGVYPLEVPLVVDLGYGKNWRIAH
jgi:DNA polymerase-1